MKIDFKALESDLVNVLKQSLKSDLPKIKEFSTKVVRDQKAALEKLARLHLDGFITDEELMSELEDERVTIENLYLTLTVEGKAATQKATNAVIKLFHNTIVNLVKTIL